MIEASQRLSRCPPVLRCAVDRDALTALPWRNDPATRRYINSPEIISVGDHLSWWERTLSDENRHLLMASIGEQPIGVLRFDLRGEDAIVSIYMDPKLHGRGLGLPTLVQGHDWLAINDERAKRIVAEIDDRNLASQKIFARAGFRPVGDRLYEKEISRPDDSRCDQ